MLRGARGSFLSSSLTREGDGRLGDHTLGCREGFYWPRQTYRGLDSVVAYGVLHPHMVTSLKRGLINRLPRALVDSPSLEMVKKGVDMALEDMV